MTEDGQEEGVVPAGPLDFPAYGRGVGVGAQDVEGEPSQDCEVFGSIFDHIRSRVIMSGEGTELPPEKGETDERKQQRRPFYAVLERLHASNDYFVRIWKLQPKFIALFGEQAEAIFDLLHNARGEIEITASTVVYQGEPKPDEMREYRTTVFGAIMGAPDPTSEKLENFRKQIDALCRPVIDRTYRADAGKRWWQFW